MRYLTWTRVVVALDVDVGGAALESGEDGGVDEANDGADVFGFAGELLDGDVLVGVFVAGEHVEGEALAGFVEDALRLLGFLEQIGDLRERGDAGRDAVAEEAGNFVEDHEARGVADGDDQRVGGLLDGHEIVAEHELDGDGAQEVVLNLEVLEVDELGVIAARECLGLGAVVDPQIGPLIGAAGGGERDDVGFGHGDNPPEATFRWTARAKRWAGRAR